MIRKIKKAFDHPDIAWWLFKYNLRKIFTIKHFSGSVKNRSQSDDGLYIASVKRFLKSPRAFNNFRRDPIYKMILEHTSKEYGQQYLDITRQQCPEIIVNSWQNCLQNDEVGNPVVFDYGEEGRVSPSTLYYMKIASDLKILFGDHIGNSIAEIGCGYGGQALILDSVFKVKSIVLFDLPSVCKLISNYLEHFTLSGSYKVSSLNQAQPEHYDFVMSNFAFSELPIALQKKYIEKVLINSDRGYLIMNSGRFGGITEDRLTIDELEKLLPKFEIFEVKPLGSSQNYLIVWGHNGSL